MASALQWNAVTGSLNVIAAYCFQLKGYSLHHFTSAMLGVFCAAFETVFRKGKKKKEIQFATPPLLIILSDRNFTLAVC